MKAADDPGGDGIDQPFLHHLEDLRTCLFRCLITLCAAVLLAFPATPHILAFLKGPLRGLVEDPDAFLRSLEVAGAFTVSLRIAFWSGLLVSAPLLVVFIASFVFPGLTRREQQVVTHSAGFAAVLFLVGVAFAYFLTLPVALKFMLSMHTWMGVRAEWTISNYTIFAIQLMLGFGLAFEMPVVVVVLGRLGVVTSRQLRDKRKYAILIILVLAAFLTPPDVSSQLLMGIPMILLYELCIWLTAIEERRRLRNAEAPAE